MQREAYLQGNEGVSQRVARMRSLSAEVIEMSRRAIRKIHPDWSERDVLLEWAAVHYGRDLADKLRDYLTEREL